MQFVSQVFIVLTIKYILALPIAQVVTTLLLSRSAFAILDFLRKMDCVVLAELVITVQTKILKFSAQEAALALLIFQLLAPLLRIEYAPRVLLVQWIARLKHAFAEPTNTTTEVGVVPHVHPTQSAPKSVMAKNLVLACRATYPHGYLTTSPILQSSSVRYVEIILTL